MPSPAEATPAYLWIPELPRVGDEFTLAGNDAHYVTRVCRVAVGETLTATDGHGGVAGLTTLSVRGEVRVRVARRQTLPDPGVAGIACGAPEGQRADWLFEKLAELGLRSVQPVDTERAEWERFERRHERWSRLAIAALRQSRQAWRLDIRSPLALDEWLAQAEGGGGRWLADPDGAPAPGLGGSASGWAVVGPSAGLTGSERKRVLERGFSPVRLAGGRLRTETAAVAWAALWAAGQPGLDPRDSTNP